MPARSAPVLRLRRRQPWARVGDVLRQFDERFPREGRLERDPVHLAHGYEDPADREVAALVASSLAFGRASSLIEKARRVLAVLGRSPTRTLRDTGDERLARSLEGWTHRWVRARDMAWLLAATRNVLREHGSLGAAFRAQLREDDDPAHLLGPMRRFALLWRETDPTPFLGGPTLSRGAAGLLPVPDGHAASKRLCLLLRWMARPADGVDLGLWVDLGPHRLTIPLDTHVARLGSYLGLTDRTTPGWAMAREITENLARFEPRDPTRLDFPLSHLGIMGGCPRRRNPRTCAACELLPACRL